MKYSYPELKQVIKNIKTFSKTYRKGSYFREGQLIRHVYLAYQWIRSQNLTKAENPKLTKQSVRPELLISIFKEWGYDINLTTQQFYKSIETQGFKIKRIKKEEYENYSNFSGKSFMKAHHSLLINPNISQENLTMPAFWNMIKLQFNYAQWPAQVRYYEDGCFIEFKHMKEYKLKNQKLPILSFKFDESFCQSKDIEFYLSIENKYEIKGTIISDGQKSYMGNSMISELIKEIAKNEK